jgi:hypothetical protein
MTYTYTKIQGLMNIYRALFRYGHKIESFSIENGEISIILVNKGDHIKRIITTR